MPNFSLRCAEIATAVNPYVDAFMSFGVVIGHGTIVIGPKMYQTLLRTLYRSLRKSLPLLVADLPGIWFT